MMSRCPPHFRHHPQACVRTTLALLAEHPSVLFIEPKLQAMPLNGRASRIVQGNDASDPSNMVAPIWDMNITGRGEIIGVADSGMDTSSCYLNGTLPGMSRVPSCSAGSPSYDLSQTKVVQYVAFVDDHDNVGGHGTHVAGTVAGDLPSSW